MEIAYPTDAWTLTTVAVLVISIVLTYIIALTR